MTAPPRRRCSCGKAAMPGDAYCAECQCTPRPLDEDYLLDFARERQRPTAPDGAGPWVYEKCPVCRHFWHGMACSMSGCDCAISWREGMA